VHLARPLVCLATLLPAFAAIYYFSYLLRFDYQLGPAEWRRISGTIAWVLAIKVAVFAVFRVDRSWGQLVAFYDLVTLIQAALCSLLLMFLVDRFVLAVPLIPRSVFFLDWGTTIVAIGGVRALLRTLRERNWLRQLLAARKVPALIVGANDTGESLLRTIRRNEALGYHVVGFIDDQRRIGTCLAGVPVIGTLDQTCDLAQRHGVDDVLVASGELSGRQIRKLIDDTRRHHVRVRVLPSYEQLISGRIAIQPQPVSINDLLRREPVQLDLENIRQWIDHRVLMVTGSAGSIGAEICRQLLQFSPRRLVLVDRAETGQFFLERELRELARGQELDVQIADVLDQRRMRRLLADCPPDIIFHAAAYKHVPLMESYPGEAVKNIVMATRRLADLAEECGVQSFVLISTDKAVNPTSVMGACKRVAELYVQAMADASSCRFVTVRFGNVLDSAGSVVQVFRQQIAQGGPVTVTDPRIQRYFMTIPEAARLVIQAGAIGQGGEILLLDMGEPVRIVDLAADMIRLSGMEVGRDIEIKFTGLRPGEKLFEELHVRGENHLPTRHPKITVVDRMPRDAKGLMCAAQRLVELADEDPAQIVPLLRQIVPQYEPSRQDQIRASRIAA